VPWWRPIVFQQIGTHATQLAKRKTAVALGEASCYLQEKSLQPPALVFAWEVCSSSRHRSASIERMIRGTARGYAQASGRRVSNKAWATRTRWIDGSARFMIRVGATDMDRVSPFR